MVKHIVQAEAIPRVAGEQRVHLDNVIRTGPQANQAGDDKVAVGGMVVVLATFLSALSLIRLLKN